MASHIIVSNLAIVTYMRGVIRMGGKRPKCLINLENSEHSENPEHHQSY